MDRVWEELCRRPDLVEALPLLFEREGRARGLRALWIRRLVAGHVESVAEVGASSRPGAPRSELTPEVAGRLSEWLSHGRAITGQLSEPRLRALAPAGESGPFVAVPLREAPAALLASVASTSAGAVELLEALVEPLSVGLANHERLHELMRLREALEADKRALLSRLERQDITDTIVGASQGLSGVMSSVAQVAPTDAPVLILGETGSGKEVVARAIHQQSRRASGPMVRVNCGAISPGLIDSELFGHERGSFTGAVAQRIGWFERADGGTLFLDEIGELPLDAQVRLLRVLQEGLVERVGSARPVHVDVRIVAATHRDLPAMVRQRSFREDLWYRLSVFIVPLPALRERRSDIPELAAHFAARAGRRLAGAPIAPSPRELDELLGYDWPGNVRELAAVIERAAILGGGKRLDVARALAGGASRPQDSPGAGAIETLDAAQRRHIEAALEHTRGRIEGPGGVAALLDINPHTLRARMRKLGIDWTRFRQRFVRVE